MFIYIHGRSEILHIWLYWAQKWAQIAVLRPVLLVDSSCKAAHRVAFELGPICHSKTTPWWGHTHTQTGTVVCMREQTTKSICRWDRRPNENNLRTSLEFLYPSLPPDLSLALPHPYHTFDKSDIYRRSLYNPQNQAQLLDDTQMHNSRNRGREKKCEEHRPNIILPKRLW